MVIIPENKMLDVVEVPEGGVINSEETIANINNFLSNYGLHELFTEVRVCALDVDGEELSVINSNNGLLIINFNNEVPVDVLTLSAASDLVMQVNNVYINDDNNIVWNGEVITNEVIQGYALKILDGLPEDVSNVVQNYLSPVLMGALCLLVSNKLVTPDELTSEAYSVLNPFYQERFAINGFKNLEREEVLMELQAAISKALTYGALTTASGESVSQVVDSDKGFVLV